ncbi:MAG: DUF2799 domain-containing protein [Syntrophales bacterium]|nr:DUF2799 domain-containing protein [Syntrophales bacterium]
MKFRGLIIILAGLLILAGCATLNKEECLSGDWHGLGMRDGVNGEPAVRIEKHRKACAEYGVQPDERRYLDGRIEGLRKYCQIDNAFRTGLDGKRYQGVCPPAIDSLFWRYNEAAYAVHQTKEEIKQLNSELSSREIRLRSKKTTDKERSHLREEIRDRDRKLDDLRYNLRNQERKLDDLMEEARQGRGVRR